MRLGEKVEDQAMKFIDLVSELSFIHLAFFISTSTVGKSITLPPFLLTILFISVLKWHAKCTEGTVICGLTLVRDWKSSKSTQFVVDPREYH